MIGSSSARIKERLTDGDVIVVEVIREPLLAQGLLGVFDINLCNEVVVGLTICGGIFLGQRVLSGKEVEDVGQEEQQSDKREDEERDEVKGEVEEIRSNAHSAHET